MKETLKSVLGELRIKPVKDLLGELKIGLIDIGASGGLEPRWGLIKNNMKAFMFEPDERSGQKLKSSNYVEAVFPMGLGAAEINSSLNLCRKPQVSSLLSPRLAFLSRFPDVKRFDIVEKIPIRLSTLDRCLMERSEDCDFIKIDTQGTELDILIGGEALLDSSIIGIEVEVEFTRLYEEQPLFGDICSYLGKKGYEFYAFVNIGRWEREKFSSFGQTVAADGLFLRPPEIFAETLSGLPEDIARSKSKKYIAIVALYDHLDLLPICMNSFNKFLDANDLRLVKRLHAHLLERRRVSNFILWVTNKLFTPFGIHVSACQAE